MSTVLLRIVGESVIQLGARRVDPGAPFLFAVLLYLGAERGRRIPRKELVETLFPDERDARAASHNLRQLLYRLRRMGAPLSLAEHAVAIEAAHVHSTIDDLLEVGVAAKPQVFPSSCVVLPHYAPPASTHLAQWVEALRDRLHTALRRQLTTALEDARRRADWRLLESIARRLLEIDPLSETATLGLAEAIARTGSKAIAVGLLEQFERELGSSGVALALPAQLLKKRISSSVRSASDLDTTTVPLLGRTEEMAELAGAWGRVRSGNFLSVCVTGEKSVGKSRLVEEFAAMVEMDGTGSIVVVRPTPEDRARPLALFADLTRQLLTLPGSAGCDPHSLPFLRRLAGASTPRGPVAGEHNQASYEDAAVRRAVGDLIASVSEERPLLCVVDNADDLDDASRALLRAAQEELPTHRVLFLLCSQRWAAGMTSLRLHPLATPDIRELLQLLVRRSGAQLGEREAAWCIDTAAGNPGHLELLVRHASHAWSPQTIPADLIALADRRIAELSVEARYALQAIAIAGDALTPMGIEALTGLGAYRLLDALNELDGSSLIVRRADGLRCRSAFLTTRALRTASPVALSVMHERAALLLEREFAAQPLSQVGAWRIASHWQQAGNRRRARECLRTCWQQAVDIGQPMVAASAIRGALEQAEGAEERAELLDDLIGALQAAGETNALEPVLRERQALSATVQDTPARRAALAFDAVEACVPNFESPCRHIACLRGHLHSRLLDPGRRIRAARLLMLAADGDLDEALARDTHLINRDLYAPTPMSRLVHRLTALVYHSVFGDRAEAMRLVEEIEQLALRGERSWYTYVARMNCSSARELAGNGPWECSDIERAYAECVQASMRVSALSCASRLATLLIDDGDVGEARKWMKTAEELWVAVGGASTPVDYHSGQIDLALLEGAADRARTALAAMNRGAEAGYACARLSNRRLVYRMRVALMCDARRPTHEELALLRQYHARAKRRGHHDDHMQVLWSALRAAGGATEASRLLRDYLRSERRDQRSCRYFLRVTTANDPAWTMPDGLSPSSPKR